MLIIDTWVYEKERGVAGASTLTIPCHLTGYQVPFRTLYDAVLAIVFLIRWNGSSSAE